MTENEKKEFALEKALVRHGKASLPFDEIAPLIRYEIVKTAMDKYLEIVRDDIKAKMYLVEYGDWDGGKQRRAIDCDSRQEAEELVTGKYHKELISARAIYFDPPEVKDDKVIRNEELRKEVEAIHAVHGRGKVAVNLIMDLFTKEGEP